jgi:hypothetical protein
VTQTGTYNPISGATCIAPSYASDLDVLTRSIPAIRDDVRTLTAGLSDAQINWRPSREHWSIAQCIKHLVLTGTYACEAQASAIAQARGQRRLSDGPYKYGGIPAKMGKMLMSSVEPPVAKKFKTAKKVVPSDHHDGGALVAEFLALQDRLERNIADAKGLDLNAASVSLPVPLFYMKLGQSLPFELAHERRHLWQARQVRSHTDFPIA